MNVANGEDLYVVVPYFDHTGARVNRRNLERCIENLKKANNCRVVISEGIWNSDCELPDLSNGVWRHFKYRYTQPLWVKENLINLALRDCGGEWKYAAWIDKDVEFTDPSWALKTLNLLKSADVIQPWSHLQFYDPKGDIIPPSVMVVDFSCLPPWDEDGIKSWCSAPVMPLDSCGHAGMAWAATRTFLERIGGVYDRCVFGGGDRFLSSILKPRHTSFSLMVSEIHGELFDQRAELCKNAILGHVEGQILHHYHGEIKNRFYRTRYQIARDCFYNPRLDVTYENNGTIRLNNATMVKAILGYFESRQEHLIP